VQFQQEFSEHAELRRSIVGDVINSNFDFRPPDDPKGRAWSRSGFVDADALMIHIFVNQTGRTPHPNH